MKVEKNLIGDPIVLFTGSPRGDGKSSRYAKATRCSNRWGEAGNLLIAVHPGFVDAAAGISASSPSRRPGS